MKSTIQFLTVLSLCFFFCFCAPAAGSDGLAPEVPDLSAADVSYAKEKLIKDLETPYISVKPSDLKDGIAVGELGVDGGDREMILAFAGQIAGAAKDTKHDTDSLLIWYRGKLIFESYYRRGRINYPHYQMSITKSWTTMAMGRAIQLGHLTMEDLQKPVISFLKNIDRSKLVRGAERITVHIAMHMGSGIRISKEKVQQLAKKPELLKGQGQIQAYMQHSEPIPDKDIKFKYQSSDPAMTMQVIEAVVPGSAKDFIKKELLEPMGITNYGWQTDVSGLPKSGAGSSFRSRDMLKMGMLVLAGGKWKGKQLIPSAFVKVATSELAKTYGTTTYGYFWWRDNIPCGDKTYICKQGRGAGGQFILMFPELAMIVVITAHNKGMGTMLKDAPKNILPAFVKN